MSSSLVRTACQRAPSYLFQSNRLILQRTAATAAPLPTSTESLNNDKNNKLSKENENLSSNEKVVSTEKKVRTSDSFVMNLFRGQFYPYEVFPYPNVLNDEQKEKVQMLIDRISKFFEEKNDPAKNDQQEKVFFL